MPNKNMSKLFTQVVDYPELQKLLRESGLNLDCLNPKQQKEYKEKTEAIISQLREKYKDWLHALDYKDKSKKEDWPKDSKEMEMRIKFNNELTSFNIKHSISVTFWNILSDFQSGNGSVIPLSLDIEDYNDSLALYPQEVTENLKLILDKIKELVKDSEAFDGTYVNIHIYW